ncbi:MAG: tetratricopeptide repeat protein [Bacteroidia bacterium]
MMKKIIIFNLAFLIFHLFCSAQTAQEYYLFGNKKHFSADYKGAIADYNKSLALNPTDWNVFFSRGLAKYHLKDYKGALVDYNKAIELNSTYEKAYFHRGNCKQTLGDTTACADWKKAALLGDKYAKGKITEYCK